MIEVTHPQELIHHVQTPITASTSILIPDDWLDAFGNLSGDDQWIHARETNPRIVPGNLLVALIPRLVKVCVRVARFKQCMTVKYEQIRFLSPMVVGERLTLSMHIVDVRRRGAGVFVDSDLKLSESTSGRTLLTTRVTDRYELCD